MTWSGSHTIDGFVRLQYGGFSCGFGYSSLFQYHLSSSSEKKSSMTAFETKGSIKTMEKWSEIKSLKTESNDVINILSPNGTARTARTATTATTALTTLISCRAPYHLISVPSQSIITAKPRFRFTYCVVICNAFPILYYIDIEFNYSLLGCAHSSDCLSYRTPTTRPTDHSRPSSPGYPWSHLASPLAPYLSSSANGTKRAMLIEVRLLGWFRTNRFLARYGLTWIYPAVVVATDWWDDGSSICCAVTYLWVVSDYKLIRLSIAMTNKEYWH